MVLEAGFLAIITSAGFYGIWTKLPKSVRDFAIKHPLLADLFILTGTYAFLGLTILAHMTCGLIVLIATSYLYVQAHREDFMYLYDAQKTISDWIANLQKTLNETGKAYREKKAARELEDVIA